MLPPPHRDRRRRSSSSSTAAAAAAAAEVSSLPSREAVEQTIRQQEETNHALRASLAKFKESLVSASSSSQGGGGGGGIDATALLNEAKELDVLQDRLDWDAKTMSARLLLGGGQQLPIPTIVEDESLHVASDEVKDYIAKQSQSQETEDGVAAGAAAADAAAEASDESDRFEDDDAADEAEALADDMNIRKATRKDYYITAFLFVLMAALTGIIAGWQTHLDESHSVFGVVGLACVTTCLGNVSVHVY